MVPLMLLWSPGAAGAHDESTGRWRVRCETGKSCTTMHQSLSKEAGCPGAAGDALVLLAAMVLCLCCCVCSGAAFMPQRQIAFLPFRP